MLKFTVNHILVENIFDFRGTNVIAINYDIQSRNRQGLEVETTAVNISKIEGGKVKEIRSFIFGAKDEIDSFASRGENDAPKTVTECPWDKESS